MPLLTTAIRSNTTAYTLKALALAGAFYFFNLANKLINEPSMHGLRDIN